MKETELKPCEVISEQERLILALIFGKIKNDLEKDKKGAEMKGERNGTSNSV